MARLQLLLCCYKATFLKTTASVLRASWDNERLGVCERREGPQLHTDSREVNWGSNPAGFSTSHAHQYTLLNTL